MAAICLENVRVDYPIYGASTRSFRQAIFARTGGLIRREGEHQRRVVVRALDNITFQLEHGDRLGLLGHNGAGKSTLLRVLAGVYEPVSGRIEVEGRISPLFNASPGLDGDDTGYENIKTCGMYLGMSAVEVARKLPQIVEFCELGNYLALPVRTYSQGMLTRLGFAIATSIDPDILLLDEGLATGDARFAERAERRMQELIDRSSILVIASHSMQMIRDICNKAMLMERGQIVAFGPIDEVIDQYSAQAQEASLAG
ncbi:MAG TPA: ABC transporter ATP-binding protein [Stellaceae bacterium]|nr:ABC transporter ATP-binding protein [Stellaceae bacterium]